MRALLAAKSTVPSSGIFFLISLPLFSPTLELLAPRPRWIPTSFAYEDGVGDELFWNFCLDEAAAEPVDCCKRCRDDRRGGDFAGRGADIYACSLGLLIGCGERRDPCEDTAIGASVSAFESLPPLRFVPGDVGDAIRDFGSGIPDRTACTTLGEASCGDAV
jgi:hypothetical protein